MPTFDECMRSMFKKKIEMEFNSNRISQYFEFVLLNIFMHIDNNLLILLSLVSNQNI